MKETYLSMGLKIIMVSMFVMGALLFLYPFVSNVINNQFDYQRVQKYQQKSEQELEKQREQLKKKQEKLTADGISAGLSEDVFNDVGKNQRLSDEVVKEHLIGVIQIPKIDVQLPVFDKTTADFLQEGATVLPGTSLPIGGDSTHSVITGHTGLSEKLLFTNLDKLVAGDVIYLSVLGKKSAYQVDQIKRVLPTNLDDIIMVPGEDLLTLVTCTPYMVNTHRLLVRGHRVALPKQKLEKAQKEIIQKNSRQLVGYLLLIALLVLFFVSVIWRQVRLYRTSHQNYKVDFRLFDPKHPLAYESFQLVEYIRRKPCLKNNQPVILVSDSKGRIQISRLPGKKYLLIPLNKKLLPGDIMLYVTRYRSKYFKIKGRKKVKSYRIKNRGTD